MKSFTAHRVPTAVNVVFAACLAFAAHGATNVFDDAVFWFRGGKDLSTRDGYMQKGEFFDDLQATNNSHANHQMAMSSESYTGQLAVFKDNAVIQKEDVVFPALGTNFVKNMQVLHIADVAKSGNYFPFDVKPRGLFARENISNEYTVVSRIRLDDDSARRTMCLMKLGYDSNARKGMWFGFAAQNADKCRRIAVQRTPSSAGADSISNFNLYVPTNTWVDLAVVVGGGLMRVGIAVPQSSANHGDNATIAFDQTAMWTDNCTVLDDENYRFFCKDGQTTYANANNTDKTAFIGSVQQLAIWKRALKEEEVMAAFGMPRPAIFRTGFDNGASNEFGGTRTNSTQTIDGLGSWQGVWNAMRTGDIWTVDFAALQDEAKQPQIFSIKSLIGSETAQIEPILNNQSLGEMRIAGSGRAFWPVQANLVVAGSNRLVIKRKDGGMRDFLIDAMELGGSLGVGKRTASSTDDGRADPDCMQTGVPSAADPNPQHWPTKLEPSTGITDFHFRVWIDPDVADKASFTFKTAVSNDTAGAAAFAVYVNDQRKTTVNAFASWKEYTFDPGKLNGGWNDFAFRSSESSCCSEFGYYRFETVLPSAFSFPPPPPLEFVISIK